MFYNVQIYEWILGKCSIFPWGLIIMTLIAYEVVQEEKLCINWTSRLYCSIVPLAEIKHIEFHLNSTTYHLNFNLRFEVFHFVLPVSDRSLLSIPRSYLATKADCAFAIRAPQLWNALPEDLGSSKSVSALKSGGKTHLYRRASL